MTLDRFNPSQEGISASQTPTFTKASPMSNVERRSSKFSNNEPQSYFLNSKNFHCESLFSLHDKHCGGKQG